MMIEKVAVEMASERILTRRLIEMRWALLLNQRWLLWRWPQRRVEVREYCWWRTRQPRTSDCGCPR